jgi:hypothetical protein
MRLTKIDFNELMGKNSGDHLIGLHILGFLQNMLNNLFEDTPLVTRRDVLYLLAIHKTPDIFDISSFSK